MTADEEYEHIEIPVRKLEVRVTLDAMLLAVAEQAKLIAQATQQPQSPVVEALNRLSELSNQIRGEVGQVGRLDASILERLQRGRSAEGAGSPGDAR